MDTVHLEEDQFLPEPPEFPDSAYEEAERTGNAMPLLFEWHKWTGLVANRVASLDPASPGYLEHPSVEVAVLRGLLNRASRLMLACLRLASSHKHAEAIRLLNRSVCETAVLVQWLCKSGSGDAFRRYLAKGLDAELRLKKHIEDNIRNRGGAIHVIEKRMLHVIGEFCALAQMTEEEVRATKPLPDFASMLRSLGHDELSYTVLQRLGSHAVHGTWPDLLSHYLEVENGIFTLSDNTIAPEGPEFVASSTLVLEAVGSFATYVLRDDEFVSEMVHMVHEAIAEIVRIYRLAAGDDHSAA
jgi:hypothetical protein